MTRNFCLYTDRYFIWKKKQLYSYDHKNQQLKAHRMRELRLPGTRIVPRVGQVDANAIVVAWIWEARLRSGDLAVVARESRVALTHTVGVLDAVDCFHQRKASTIRSARFIVASIIFEFSFKETNT